MNFGVFFECFLSPSSICESLLSLLRLRFTEVSIFSSFFPIVVNDAVTVISAVVVLIGVFVAFIVVVDYDDFAVAVVAVVVSGVLATLIVFDYDDDDDFVVAAVIILVVVGGFSVSAFLEGVFFLFPVTRVHPSSSLSRRSPTSGCGFSFDLEKCPSCLQNQH